MTNEIYHKAASIINQIYRINAVIKLVKKYSNPKIEQQVHLLNRAKGWAIELGVNPEDDALVLEKLEEKKELLEKQFKEL